MANLKNLTINKLSTSTDPAIKFGDSGILDYDHSATNLLFGEVAVPTTATGNILIGKDLSFSEGYNNVLAIGQNNNISGGNSIIIGRDSEISGGSSIGIGVDTKAKGQGAISIGYQSESLNTGTVGIGYQAYASAASSIAVGYKTTSLTKHSIALGREAFAGHKDDTAAAPATIAIGYKSNAGYSGSIAIGSQASTGTTTNSVAIGTNSTVNGNGGIAIGNGCKIGTGTNIGAGNLSGQSGIHIGCGGQSYLSSYSAVSTTDVVSDIRDKIDFKPITNSLEFINKLNPITFRSNIRSLYKNDDEFDNDGYNNGSKAGNRRIPGFIAQDVYSSLIDTYHDDNYAKIVSHSLYDNPNSEVDQYTMSYSAMIPFLVQAIQEQDKIISEQIQLSADICRRIELLESK